MMEVTTTYLEMLSPHELKARHAPQRLTVREITAPQWHLNRSLYFTVGEQWQWFDKRPWSDEQWCAYATDPALRTFLGDSEGEIAGYYELHRDGSEIEIAYFGLMPAFIGRRLGGALLTDAIEQAWRWDASRVWVHTCTLDHPAALQNYVARGFRICNTSTHLA